MFVRSVVLSLDAFKRNRQFFPPKGWQGGAEMVVDSGAGSSSELGSSTSFSYHPAVMARSVDDDEDESSCKLTSFVEHNSIRLLQDLMCAVRLEDINQVCSPT